MPHLAHRRVPPAVSSPLASRSPSPSLPSHAIPQPGIHDLQSPKRAIIRNPKTWPPFPPPQSLTDDTAQLHLTLRSPLSSHSHSLSPSPTPSRHLSRHPSSSSGRATPDSSDSSALPILAIESFDSGNPTLVPQSSAESPSPTEKTRSKKNNRVSAASLSSLLSANYEDKRERRDRKRTEKLAKHEQTLLELRTADRRRAYFRDASHRQELTFGPEVRTICPLPLFHKSPFALATQPNHNPPQFQEMWITNYLCFGTPLGHIYDRFLLWLSSVHPGAVSESARRHLV
jgi:hypothetical protein